MLSKMRKLLRVIIVLSGACCMMIGIGNIRLQAHRIPRKEDHVGQNITMIVRTEAPALENEQDEVHLNVHDEQASNITSGQTDILRDWQQKHHWESKLDKHEYPYLINPSNLCKGSAHITLLILVKSRTGGITKRNSIRQTYGEGVLRYNVSAKILFLVGISQENGDEEQAEIYKEADAYGDILQENFIDSYYNLTVKLIMGFKWASTFCNNSDYVMSVDDDAVIDVVNLAKDLASMSSEFDSKFVLAEPAISWEVHRDPGDKWYTPPELYAKDNWPPFPRGYGYIVSKDVGYNLYLASQKIAPPAPWDDVYCGMLLQSLGIEMIDIRSWFRERHGSEKQPRPLNVIHHYVIFQFNNHQIVWKAIEGRYSG